MSRLLTSGLLLLMACVANPVFAQCIPFYSQGEFQAFMEESGRNRTPDKLPARERDPLFALCDGALRKVVAALEPQRVLGVGGFAERRAREALEGTGMSIGTILHPSPASPAANRGWSDQAEAQLARLGVRI